MEAGRPRWDINLSWKGPHSGKMRTKMGWIFFAHNKKLFMGDVDGKGVVVNILSESNIPQKKNGGGAGKII